MSKETEYIDAKATVVKTVKSHMYDIGVIILVVIIIIASLNIFDMREITPDTILQTIWPWIPYYIALVMLKTLFYSKGKAYAKAQQSYITLINAYSTQVNGLSGNKLAKLYDYCDNYNEHALHKIKEAILKRAALSYDMFDSSYNNGLPLKIYGYSELKKLGLTRLQIFAVIKAKYTKVAGITPNTLLSSINEKDPTYLGKTESELAKAETTRGIATSILSVGFLLLVTIKDIVEWGWLALPLVIFKTGYVVACAYVRYFAGVSDISIGLTNHYSRKIDILKEYEYWYNDHYEKV